MAAFHTPLTDTIMDKSKSFYGACSLGSMWGGVTKEVSHALSWIMKKREGFLKIFCNVLLQRFFFYDWNSWIKCASLIGNWIDSIKTFYWNIYFIPLTGFKKWCVVLHCDCPCMKNEYGGANILMQSIAQAPNPTFCSDRSTHTSHKDCHIKAISHQT